jgi:hypothetical protein
MNRSSTKMFRSSGALGTFSSKIGLAYLMGMITEEAFRDLENMKDIRNKFAHHLDVGSFTVQAIANRCLNFKMVDRYVIDPVNGVPGDSSALFGLAVNGARARLKEPKDRYLLTGQIFDIGLQHATPDAKPWTPLF